MVNENIQLMEYEKCLRMPRNESNRNEWISDWFFPLPECELIAWQGRRCLQQSRWELPDAFPNRMWHVRTAFVRSPGQSFRLESGRATAIRTDHWRRSNDADQRRQTWVDPDHRTRVTSNVRLWSWTRGWRGMGGQEMRKSIASSCLPCPFGRTTCRGGRSSTSREGLSREPLRLLKEGLRFRS